MSRPEFIEKLFALCLSGPLANSDLSKRILPLLEKYRSLAQRLGPTENQEIAEIFDQVCRELMRFFG